MPLSMARPGKEKIMENVHETDGTGRLLKSLGFVEGAAVKIIRMSGETAILYIKQGKAAPSRPMAKRRIA